MRGVTLNVEEATEIVAVACLAESRTNAEQRVLLRFARKVDQAANANVTGNRRMWGDRAGSVDAVRQMPESRLEVFVDCTRVLDDGDRVVTLPEKRKAA